MSSGQILIPADELLDWFRTARRDLPWRAPDVTAWQILVSEFMLQQTPVSRVEPIWRDWIARWPTPSATAAAGAADVLRAWGKLGYPRRAKRLHECAEVIAAEHGDEVPRDVETLLTLPGVGAYTARAVACFAYQQDVPVVDTNVRRVVARAIRGVADTPARSRDLDDVAALLPEDGTAHVFSAALMELGAIVCTARAPLCSACPVAAWCEWRGSGYPENAPTVRRQATFQGSDRQVRGRIMALLRNASEPVASEAALAAAAEGGVRDEVQPRRAYDSLVSAGLLIEVDGHVRLP